MAAMLPLRCLSTLLVATLCTASLAAQSHARLVPNTERPLTAETTAGALGVGPLLTRLQRPGEAPVGLQQIADRQRILLATTAASLEVDATTGQIDNEIAQARELENYLTSRRARQIDLLNLASLAIGGSLGTASAALGFTPHLRASGVTGIISGVSTTTLSVIGLRVGPGGKQVLDAHSNMLSKLFDLPSDPNDFYPPLIARFMDSPAPNDPDNLSRRARLIQSWEKLGRIPPPGSPHRAEKITRLASIPQQNTSLSIGDLEDRTAMLYDLRARITYEKRDLAILLDAVLANPVPGQP